MAQQTLDNNEALSVQRAKINNNALDAVSKSDPTTQALASSINFATPGEGVQFQDGDKFDAYEAFGFWTPTYTTTGTDFDSVTYDPLTLGTYGIAGKTLTLWCKIRTDAIVLGSASGSVTIGGMPLPASASSPRSAGSIGLVNTFLVNSPGAIQTISGDSVLIPRQGNFLTSLAPSDMSLGANGNEFEFTISYLVD